MELKRVGNKSKQNISSGWEEEHFFNIVGRKERERRLPLDMGISISTYIWAYVYTLPSLL